MDHASSARYCRSCGTRLASANRGRACGPCEAKERELHTSAPSVVADFWGTDEMRDALDSRHMGRVIAAFRRHPYHGRTISQEVVGRWVHLTQAQLSRLENGLPIKDLDKLILWARTLRIPPHLLWFKLPDDDRAAAAEHRPARGEDAVRPTSS